MQEKELKQITTQIKGRDFIITLKNFKGDVNKAYLCSPRRNKYFKLHEEEHWGFQFYENYTNLFEYIKLNYPVMKIKEIIILN